MPAQIHPTAEVDPTAELADDVIVGAHAIIEGRVVVGAGCVIQAHAQLIGPMTLGAKNLIGRGAILGDEPQHLAATGEGADLDIGDGNVFREYATVHRGSAPGKVTRIGHNNFFMGASHVGHDSTVGNRCILANNALIAGHCVLHDNVYISGNSAVHQRTHLGRLSMLSGTSAITKDLPPFMIAQTINTVMGINVVGMRRNGYTRSEIDAVRQAFRMLFLRGNLVPVAADQIESELGHVPAVAEIIDFVRTAPNGITCSVGRETRRAA